MKEIEEFKRQNSGTINYTVKELIGAIHVKLDHINNRLEKGTGKIAANRVGIAKNWALIKILITAIVIDTFGIVLMLLFK